MKNFKFKKKTPFLSHLFVSERTLVIHGLGRSALTARVECLVGDPGSHVVWLKKKETVRHK